MPPDAAGHIRFYVDGGYAQPAGATTGSEVSIWSWDGQTAKALFRGKYISVADDQPKIEEKSARLLIHPKTQYRVLSACGACSGRKLIWTLDLSGDGVKDLGKRPEIPEADLVDEVFFRLWHGKDTNTLAAPKALEQMAAIVAETKKGKTDPKFPSLGMLMSIMAERHGDHTKLIFDTDVDAAPQMVASVLHKKSGYYLENFEFSLGNRGFKP